ncbi:MAG: STAS domain-containing protein [Cyanobacteriota bacterium]
MSQTKLSMAYKYQDNTIIKLPYSDFNERTSKEFRFKIKDLIANYDHFTIIVDFSKINFIDDSGLAAIVYAWHKCSNNNIQFMVCNLNEISTLLLLRKGLDKILQISFNLKEAINIGNQYIQRKNRFDAEKRNIKKVFGDFDQDIKSKVA